MTHPPRAHVNTCVQVCTQLTHVLSQKVLSLTKLKGKIYKTKSLGHYITQVFWYTIKQRNKKYQKDTYKYVLILYTTISINMYNLYIYSKNFIFIYTVWMV